MARRRLTRRGRSEWRGRQVRELAQTQVGDVDEVLRRPEAARGALGLLHRHDEGVAAVVEHAVHDGVEVRSQGSLSGF